MCVFVQNVVERVSSLPLVSSTYGLMSSVYLNTKSSHPYIRTVCEVAELGLQSISSVVLTTASPIIDKLEPQRKHRNRNVKDNIPCNQIEK